MTYLSAEELADAWQTGTTGSILARLAERAHREFADLRDRGGTGDPRYAEMVDEILLLWRLGDYWPESGD